MILLLILKGSIRNIYLNYGGRLEEQTIRTYTEQILLGLCYLHENKVAHCDLKCANVLVDANGVVKLSDFGCAKRFETSLSKSELNGAIRGSLGWMAPEVLKGMGYGSRADIWSLGCTVIEMAIGGQPWGEDFDNNFEVMMMIAESDRLPPVPQWLSPECANFVRLCLQRDPQLRPTA